MCEFRQTIIETMEKEDPAFIESLQLMLPD
jgi:hypothetical protein